MARKILRTSDEEALGGGNCSTQWRRRRRDPEYAAIWFGVTGQLCCFEDDRDKYWEKQRKNARPLNGPAVKPQKRQSVDSKEAV